MPSGTRQAKSASTSRSFVGPRLRSEPRIDLEGSPGCASGLERFPTLGIAAQVLPKVRRVENEPVGNALVRGEAELGVQQIAELRGVKGVDYVGPFPDAVQRVSVFAVGISTKAPNPAGARALVDLVLSPPGQAVLRESGLEPIAR